MTNGSRGMAKLELLAAEVLDAARGERLGAAELVDLRGGTREPATARDLGGAAALASDGVDVPLRIGEAVTPVRLAATDVDRQRVGRARPELGAEARDRVDAVRVDRARTQRVSCRDRVRRRGGCSGARG